MELFYDIFRVFGVVTGYPIGLLFFKTKIYYQNSKAPKLNRIKGGALIISNHFNAMDYVHNALIFFPRKLYVVAGEIAFRNFWITLGMKFWGGIQANRVTKDMSFIQKSADLMRKGKLVQIFPEGRNTDDGKLQPFFPSYITMALSGEAPIIPVICDGTYSLFKRTHAIVGEPIDLWAMLGDKEPTKEDIEHFNKIIHTKALELQQELEMRKKNGKKGGAV